MQNLCGNPQHAEGHHHPHERWEMRHGLKQRDKQEPTDAHDENEVSLSRGGHTLKIFSVFLIGAFHLPLHLQRHDAQWHHHTNDARQNEVGDDHRGRQLAPNPQHRGGDVSDRRPSPSRIGRNDDRTGKKPSGRLVCDELPKEGNHHNGRGKVVERSTKEKSEHPNDPEQPALLPRGNAVGDHRKSIVSIDQFDNRHGSHQEEKDAGNLLHVMKKTMLKEDLQSPVVSVAVAIKKFLKRADQMVWRIAPPQNENGPAQCAGNQSTCRLVDVQVVLECN